MGLTRCAIMSADWLAQPNRFIPVQMQCNASCIYKSAHIQQENSICLQFADKVLHHETRKFLLARYIYTHTERKTQKSVINSYSDFSVFLSIVWVLILKTKTQQII